MDLKSWDLENCAFFWRNEINLIFYCVILITYQQKFVLIGKILIIFHYNTVNFLYMWVDLCLPLSLSLYITVFVSPSRVCVCVWPHSRVMWALMTAGKHGGQKRILVVGLQLLLFCLLLWVLGQGTKFLSLTSILYGPGTTDVYCRVIFMSLNAYLHVCRR